MKVYEKKFIVKKKPDGTGTLSVALSDVSVISVTMSVKDAQQLYIDLEQFLKKEPKYGIYEMPKEES